MDQWLCGAGEAGYLAVDCSGLVMRRMCFCTVCGCGWRKRGVWGRSEVEREKKRYGSDFLGDLLGVGIREYGPLSLTTSAD